MKFSIFVLLLSVAAIQAVRLGGASEDLIAQKGQCAFGLPRDGRFAKCELGDWKIGRNRLAKPVEESDISFSEDFVKGWKEDFTNSSAESCSATIPGHAVLYQRLSDDILYAHYRLRACARVLGNTPCSVVVKTARNEIYDKLEFSPDSDLSCSPSPSRDCISDCHSNIESISLRYVGALPAHIRVRAPELGVNDWVDAGDFKYGDEATYNLDNLAAWFNNSIDFFPDVELETIFGNNASVIDIVSFNCSTLSVAPGKRLGDLKQFLVLSLSASEGDFCNWNDLSRNRGNCTCENSAAKEVCMYSDKGFVADPSEEFYIGLESASCGCSFDNICLEQVNGDEGYFGLDWILHDEKKDNKTDDSA